MKILKYFLSTGLLLVAATAHAEHSENLVNLNYYPHQYHLLFTPRVTTTLHDSLVADDEITSQQTGDSTSNFTQADIGISYGLLPGFRLNASETELFSS